MLTGLSELISLNSVNWIQPELLPVLPQCCWSDVVGVTVADGPAGTGEELVVTPDAVMVDSKLCDIRKGSEDEVEGPFSGNCLGNVAEEGEAGRRISAL